jgi:transposase
MDTERKGYPSDLTDEQWQVVRRLLPRANQRTWAKLHDALREPLLTPEARFGY